MKTLFSVLDTIIDILSAGLSIAVYVMAITLSILLIYRTPNMDNLSLIGAVGGLFLSFVLLHRILKEFGANEISPGKAYGIKINSFFWFMAFCLGGAITTQYLDYPDTVMPASTIIQFALIMTIPSIVQRMLDHMMNRFVVHSSAEKTKNLPLDISRLTEMSAVAIPIHAVNYEQSDAGIK